MGDCQLLVCKANELQGEGEDSSISASSLNLAALDIFGDICFLKCRVYKVPSVLLVHSQFGTKVTKTLCRTRHVLSKKSAKLKTHLSAVLLYNKYIDIRFRISSIVPISSRNI